MLLLNTEDAARMASASTPSLPLGLFCPQNFHFPQDWDQRAFQHMPPSGTQGASQAVTSRSHLEPPGVMAGKEV